MHEEMDKDNHIQKENNYDIYIYIYKVYQSDIPNYRELWQCNKKS